MTVESGRPGVLIVDDAAANVRVLEAMLGDLDLRLISATSGEAALRCLLQEEELAVILLDLHMPGMDGLETAARIRLRARSRQIPIIFVTAAAEFEGPRQRAYELGAVDFIAKPIQVEILRAKVRSFVELYRARDEVRRQSEQVVALTQLLENILESSTHHAIVAVDREGLVETWNEGARNIYERSKEEAVGRLTMSALLMRDDRAGADEFFAIGRVAAEQGMTEVTTARVRSDGRPMSISTSITPRLDGRGRLVGYVCISEDITERLRLEAELRQKNEQLAAQNVEIERASQHKSAFLANMSHELRTPLTGIIGFAQLLRDQHVGPLSDRQIRSLDYVLVSSRHLLGLITEILDLVSIEAGKLVLRPERIDLEALVRQVVGSLESVLHDRQVVIEIQIELPATETVLDGGRLKQVIYNLLSNAIKYSPVGGTVLIRIEPDDADHFRLAVADQGPGIDPADQARLFTVFERLDADNDARLQGAGLGLALTRRIVEAQGGRVGIKSARGQGATFTVVLPHRPAVPTDPTTVATAYAAEARAVPDQAGHAASGPGGAVDDVRLPGPAPADVRLPEPALDVARLPEPEPNVARLPEPALDVAPLPEPALDVTRLMGPEPDDARLSELEPDVARLPEPILVVEDSPISAVLLEQLFEFAGYEVAVVPDGQAALDLIASLRPRLILTDLRMPGMDGIELIQTVRAGSASRDAVIVAVSASAQKIDLERATAAGCDGYVTKPIDTAGLIPSLQGIVRSRCAAGGQRPDQPSASLYGREPSGDG